MPYEENSDSVNMSEPAVKQDTQVTRELKRLTDEIGGNNSLVNKLAEKIKPLLRQSSPKGEGLVEDKLVESLAPLAMHIRGERMCIENSNKVLKDVLQRLEL